MALLPVNYLAVLGTAVVSFLIGFVWYSPKVFGTKWSALTGVQMGGNKEGMMKGMIGGFVSTIVFTFVLAQFVAYAAVTTFVAGATLGVLAWLGFNVTSQLGGLLWKGESTELFAINVLHSLVMFIVAAGLLTVWV